MYKIYTLYMYMPRLHLQAPIIIYNNKSINNLLSTLIQVDCLVSPASLVAKHWYIPESLRSRLLITREPACVTLSLKNTNCHVLIE